MPVQQPQHGRMQRIVEMRHFFVGTVNCQCVLDQVVGTDRQEVQFFHEHVERQRGEQAQYNRLLSTREFASTNIPLQIRKYYLDLKEAEQTSRASKDAYTNAKKWAVTAIANFDFGIGPAKEIFEALQAYARMRASYFQSIYNYRIARSNLDYATGELPPVN